MARQRSKRRRGVGLFLLSGLLIALLAAWGYLLMLDIDNRDRKLIAATRVAHHTLFRMNKPMVGTPDVNKLSQRLTEHGVSLGSPIYMRIFKREFELELWMQRDGRFHRFATYPICMWSGTLGPKHKEGDRQSPEGFYTVAKSQLNPNSRWHRSFNLGYPNAFDRQYDRTGSFLMVHGGCGSVGCYAMTDPVITELWSVVTAALDNGQKRFHVHVFPFRMSDEALEEHRNNPNYNFWKMLKRGHDAFEAAWQPPQVSVCEKTYHFAAPKKSDGSDPIIENCANQNDPPTGST